MSVVKADRFTALKAKVKAEMLRRNQDGSVADYGGAAYDYTVEPAAGKTVRPEHRDKLVSPMRAVNSDLVPASVGSVIKESELANLEARVAVWEARSMTDQSGSDCKSGCTGTCYTGCATGCSSCGVACSTGCGNACEGCYGCGGECSSGCKNTCENVCKGCDSVCGDSCTGCGWSCKGTCSGECGSGCDSGCGTSCSLGCANTQE